MEEILTALRAHRFSHVTEDDLQRGIAQVLGKLDMDFTREVYLSSKDRIDFMVGEVGIEVKDDGSLTALTRQIHRYLQFDSVKRLLVVTTRSQHLRIPSHMSGKEVRVYYVNPLL